MFDRTSCDRTTQFGDLLGDRPRVGFVEPLQCGLADAIQVGVIPPGQLDEDRFLGVEVVVETARENPRGVGDLLQGGAQARGRDHRVGGLQDLGAPGRFAGGIVDTCGLAATLGLTVSATRLRRGRFSWAATHRVVDVCHRYPPTISRERTTNVRFTVIGSRRQSLVRGQRLESQSLPTLGRETGGRAPVARSRLRRDPNDQRTRVGRVGPVFGGFLQG